MDFITIIILLGIVQGVFLGILLLTLRRGNVRANHLLGILMFLFSISISGFFLSRISASASAFLRNSISTILINELNTFSGKALIELFGQLPVFDNSLQLF